MARRKLTQAGVDKVQPPAAGRIDIFDVHLPGFGLRVSAGGHKSWFVYYRFGGKQRRHTIGTLGTFPKVEAAREEARLILQSVARGVDPAAARKAEPTAAPLTFRELADRFIERWAKKHTRSWRGTQRILELHVLATWGDRPAASITKKDVHRLLADAAERVPVGVNRVLATIRKLFNWAVELDELPAAPTTGVRALAPETRRDRTLTDDELAAVWVAADGLGVAGAALIRLLVLTAQRRDEVARMRWVDLDLERRVWTLPRAATKADREHVVPLSPSACDLLTALRATAEADARDRNEPVGDFVITTTRGKRPLSGYSKLKVKLDRDSKTAGWHLHDLRRTVATGLAWQRVPSHVIGRVLNHALSGVTDRVYNKYEYLEEKRAALDAWARHIEALVNPTHNVVELRRAAN